MSSEAPAADAAPLEAVADSATVANVNVVDDAEGGIKLNEEAQSAANNNLFSKAATITRGVLNSAAESIQTSVKHAQASLRIPRKTDEAAGQLEEGGAVPTDVTSSTGITASVLTTDYDASAAGGAAALPASNPAAPAAANPAALAASLLEAADRLSRKTRESGSAAYQAAVQGIKRLTAPSRRVATVCKAELRVKPCPQTLLLCCNLIASKQGLGTQGLFKLPPPRGLAEVERLADNLEGGSMLLPADLEPLAAAALVKHFLASLEDPLLTARLVDRWVSAGLTAEQGEAAGLRAAVQELPLANASALRLLIETCYRVASQSNVTGMNALGLATELAPVMLWHEAGTQPSAATTAAHAPQHASAQQQGSGAKPVSTFEALKARLGRGGSATSAPGEGLPPIAPTSDTATATTESDGGSTTAAASAADSTGAGAGTADTATAAAGPTISRDLDDVLSEGDHLEHVPEQATGTSGATAAAIDAPAAAGSTAEGAAGAAAGAASSNVSNKCVLQGKELEAVVRAVEYMILLFDDVFA